MIAAIDETGSQQSGLQVQLIEVSVVSVEAAGAGWSSLAARRAHNPKVEGSNPSPATNLNLWGYLRIELVDTGLIALEKEREIMCEALE